MLRILKTLPEERCVDTRLLSDRFPLSNKYNPAWLVAGCSGGANPLWLTEWLTRNLELRPGMRVLDLGCGRALSSIFLRLEFEVEVWACRLVVQRLSKLEENPRRRCREPCLSDPR